MRHAVIVGATGLTGLALARILAAERNGLPVRALLRRPAPELPPGIDQVVLGHLDREEDLLPHIPPGAWVFCCIGTTMRQAGSQEAYRAVDVDIPLAVAHAAAQAGADGMSIVTAAGAKANGFFFYNRIKGEVELGVQAAGLPAVHIFRPGVLLGRPSAQYRFGERFAIGVSKLFSWLWQGPLARYGPIEAADLAQAMLNMARKGHRGLRVFEGKTLQAAAER